MEVGNRHLYRLNEQKPFDGFILIHFRKVSPYYANYNDERQRELFDAQCCVLQRFDVFPWRAEARLRRNSSLLATSIRGNKRV